MTTRGREWREKTFSSFLFRPLICLIVGEFVSRPVGLTDRRTDGRTKEWTHGRTDGWTDGRTDERTDVRTDGRTDGQTVRRTGERTGIPGKRAGGNTKDRADLKDYWCEAKLKSDFATKTLSS